MIKPHIFKFRGWWKVTPQPLPMSKSNILWAPAYAWVATRNSAEHKWWEAPIINTADYSKLANFEILELEDLEGLL